MMSSKINEKIHVFFLIPKDYEDSSQCDDNMKAAYNCCKQSGYKTLWIKELECLSRTWEKTDIVILQHYEGEILTKLTNEKCVRTLGPRCLHDCLLKSVAIPNSPTLVFTTAMRDLTVCSSGLPLSKKKHIRRLVNLMGGHYTTDLTNSTTHLIVDCVNRAKYEKACENKIPVMLEFWVDAVWQESLENNICADSPKFIKKYKCPPFYKLIITSSGLHLKEREEISNLITTYGGVYSSRFQTESTNFVICHSGTNSEKFKAAIQHKIPCCTVNWIKDSVKSGFALPIEKYRVSSCLSSTQLNPREFINPNYSTVSTIIGDGEKSIRNFADISETKLDISTFSVNFSTSTPVIGRQSEKNDVISSIDLKKCKEAGPFLDGCNIFLTGFNSVQREKLNKIINSGSATRYDNISDRLTHVIVGDVKSANIESIIDSGYRPAVVSVNWLLESMKLKHPASEDLFKVSGLNNLEAPNSPLIEKGLQILHEKSVNPTTINDNALELNTEDEINIINQYLQNENTENTLQFNQHQNMEKQQDDIDIRCANENITESSETINDEEETELFKDLTFCLRCNDEDMIENLKEYIEQQGGIIKSSDKGVDYLIVPRNWCSDNISAKNVVTNLWIEDCIASNEVTPVDYYHKPIYIPTDVVPLKDCTICVSTYTRLERTFLNWLIQELGATLQESLAKVSQPKKNILPSTHLVCPTPLGSKYAAAYKWGLKIASHEWLLACAKKRAHVAESDFPVSENQDDDCTITEVVAPQSKTPSNKVKEKTTNITTLEKSSKKSVSSVSSYQNVENVPDMMINSKGINEPFDVGADGSTNRSDAIETDLWKKNEKANESKGIKRPLVEANNDPEVTETNLLKKNGNESPFRTPTMKNKRLMLDLQNSPRIGSQMTPVSRFLEEIGVPRGGSPSTPDQSFDFNDSIDTPEQPLGRVFGNPNPSPATRKYWAKEIDRLAWHPVSPPLKHPRRPSTPLSEVKERLWQKILNRGKTTETNQPTEDNVFRNEDNTNNESNPEPQIDDPEPPIDNPEPPIHDPVVHNQLQQLHEMLTRNKNSGVTRKSSLLPSDITLKYSEEIVPGIAQNINLESQVDTIGWEEPIELNSYGTLPVHSKSTIEQPKKFMLTKFDLSLREMYSKQIESLGGAVCDLQQSTYDPTATHLLCGGVPSRNEKFLASIAAGKWVLDISYLESCVKLGKFLDEEEFEFGNPKASHLLNNVDAASMQLVLSIYQWRKRIKETGKKVYEGMCFILLADKKEQLCRLIEAGGGKVIKTRPPYDNLQDVTHCVIDMKQIKEYLEECKLFASKGIFCVPSLFLNDILTKDPAPKVENCIIPVLKRYYVNN